MSHLSLVNKITAQRFYIGTSLSTHRPQQRLTPMPIPLFRNPVPAEAHTPLHQPQTPTPTPTTQTGVTERTRRSRAPSSRRAFEFPQRLLEQIRIANDRASREDPEGRIYVLTLSVARAFAEPVFLILGVFTTLRTANTAAMNYFRDHNDAFFQEERVLHRWSSFWVGAGRNTCHQVRWNTDGGRLCLVTRNQDGDQFVLDVQARLLDILSSLD